MHGTVEAIIFLAIATWGIGKMKLLPLQQYYRKHTEKNKHMLLLKGIGST
jgi:hypothetical protein